MLGSGDSSYSYVSIPFLLSPPLVILLVVKCAMRTIIVSNADQDFGCRYLSQGPQMGIVRNVLLDAWNAFPLVLAWFVRALQLNSQQTALFAKRDVHHVIISLTTVPAASRTTS